MSARLDPATAYKRVDFDAYVLGAESTKLSRLCFDDVDAALARAIWAEDQQRREIRRKSLERAQLGLIALTSGIDPGNPLAATLETFYRSIMKRLAQAASRFDAAEIEAMRGDLRDISGLLAGEAS